MIRHVRVLAPRLGSRTVVGLVRAAVPQRFAWHFAFMAGIAALGAWATARGLVLIGSRLDVPWHGDAMRRSGALIAWAGAELTGIAGTLKAMPLWIVLSHSMAQVTARLIEAEDAILHHIRDLRGH